MQQVKYCNTLLTASLISFAGKWQPPWLRQMAGASIWVNFSERERLRSCALFSI